MGLVFKGLSLSRFTERSRRSSKIVFLIFLNYSECYVLELSSHVLRRWITRDIRNILFVTSVKDRLGMLVSTKKMGKLIVGMIISKCLLLSVRVVRRLSLIIIYQR